MHRWAHELVPRTYLSIFLCPCLSFCVCRCPSLSSHTHPVLVEGDEVAPVTLLPSHEPRGSEKVTTPLALGHGHSVSLSPLVLVLTHFTCRLFSYLCTHCAALLDQKRMTATKSGSLPLFLLHFLFPTPTTSQLSLTVTKGLRGVKMFRIVTSVHTSKDLGASKGDGKAPDFGVGQSLGKMRHREPTTTRACGRHRVAW